MKKQNIAADDTAEAGQEEAVKATFMPSATFDAYPEGKKVHFIAGKESAPVPIDFIAFMRAKGLMAE